MLNEKKVSLMTRLAIVEKEDKQEFKIHRFYPADYVRYNILKTLVSVTIAYILILAMYAFYHAEYLIQSGTELNWEYIGMTALNVYVVMIAVYAAVTLVAYTVRYAKSSRVIKKYAKNIRVLQEFYNKKDEEVK